MLDALADWLFDPSGPTPHGFCLLREGWLTWTHALANLGIGVAHCILLLALAVFARRRRDRVPSHLTVPWSADSLGLAEAARGWRPRLPVVRATGHLDPLLRRQLPERVGFLQKPYGRPQLAVALRRALDGFKEPVLA